MNKQELIDELASLVGSIEDFKGISTFHDGKYAGLEHALELIQQLDELQNPVESKITDEQAWNKVAEAYPESAQSLRNTLDNAVFGKTGEHQKPVVPKFVAEWIEYAKKKGDSLAISFKPWNLYGVEYSKADRWIEDNQETFARAWIDGYEVEKKPKYIVKIGKLYLKEPLGDTSNSTILTTWDKKRAYPFSSFHTADKHADKFEGAVVEVAEG
ncbi:DUF1642 domain-containing protein [Enterococcus faecium]|uniref:DUF1642 domain-containing protein n=1 Tax=Enterococcus faecium TaxID=1352 RepID=UPI0010270DA7|nr:DUF1642 domain-containing protein [Enterococcus faecium]VFA71324.1 phage protein, putative [Enterococcus faecium]